MMRRASRPAGGKLVLTENSVLPISSAEQGRGDACEPRERCRWCVLAWSQRRGDAEKARHEYREGPRCRGSADPLAEVRPQPPAGRKKIRAAETVPVSAQ